MSTKKVNVAQKSILCQQNQDGAAQKMFCAEKS